MCFGPTHSDCAESIGIPSGGLTEKAVSGHTAPTGGSTRLNLFSAIFGKPQVTKLTSIDPKFFKRCYVTSSNSAPQVSILESAHGSPGSDGTPFKPMKEVDLKWVRLKATFLVAITSTHRVPELGALSCRSNLCVFHPNKVVLRTDPAFRPKVVPKFHIDLELVLPSFCP